MLGLVHQLGLQPEQADIGPGLQSLIQIAASLGLLTGLEGRDACHRIQARQLGGKLSIGQGRAGQLTGPGPVVIDPPGMTHLALLAR
ncbi:hypothetical protein SDC9_198227 [bioreactor metagenome]|uniref:Uncharacterized protein n=1 Tax=bioreactor metagenome TaxID=1076179 RepID=A0A645IHX6_9ZZZZ